MLLLPDIIELSKKDMRLVVEHIDVFRNAGFELEEFGENTIKITGVPEICFEMNTRDLFLDIIDGMDITNKTTTEEVENKFIATVACQAAVKANMKLSEQELQALLDELLLLENPFTCPHGRPTAIRMTKDEIEKKFKRKGF
jgi:DNA mismatch repair protein MutL